MGGGCGVAVKGITIYRRLLSFIQEQERHAYVHTYMTLPEGLGFWGWS
jgi:hypothetical protein